MIAIDALSEVASSCVVVGMKNDTCRDHETILIDGARQWDCFVDWNRCQSHDLPACWDAGIRGGATHPKHCSDRYRLASVPKGDVIG